MPPCSLSVLATYDHPYPSFPPGRSERLSGQSRGMWSFNGLGCCGTRKSENGDGRILRSPHPTSVGHPQEQKRGVVPPQPAQRVKLGVAQPHQLTSHTRVLETMPGLQVDDSTIVVGAEQLGLVLGISSKGVIVQSIIRGSAIET
eukprot:768766-Hanusia_phi.AAC.18